jgi:hypothetical protein
MSDFTERLIADFACLDPVYVDGIFAEGVMNLGANFATPYFRWAPRGRGDNGDVSMERTPALFLIRPRSSLLPHSPLAALIDRQPGPVHYASELRVLAH